MATTVDDIPQSQSAITEVRNTRKLLRFYIFVHYYYASQCFPMLHTACRIRVLGVIPILHNKERSATKHGQILMIYESFRRIFLLV